MDRRILQELFMYVDSRIKTSFSQFIYGDGGNQTMYANFKKWIGKTPTIIYPGAVATAGTKMYASAYDHTHGFAGLRWYEADGSPNLYAHSVKVTNAILYDLSNGFVELYIKAPRNVIGGNAADNAPGAGVTTYHGAFVSGAFGAEAQNQIAVPFDCTVKNLYVDNGATQPASGSQTFTIRKNGADTTIVATHAAGAAAAMESDTSHSASFAAGDLLSLKIVNNASGSGSGVRGWTVELDAT